MRKPATPEPRRALVLHDHELLVGVIELALNHGVFVVKVAKDLAQAERALADWRPHLTVLDMEHDDCGALLKAMATDRSDAPLTTPVLGLTRRGDLATKLKAFQSGVDDIITVPFSPEELVARAIVITRRVTDGAITIIPTLQLGDLQIDIMNREVRAGDSIIHLSSIEQSLLYLFASHSERLLTREDILDAIWGTDFLADSNIVDRHVRSLRAKLQNDYKRPRFIATVHGKGYRFVPTFTRAGWVGQPADP